MICVSLVRCCVAAERLLIWQCTFHTLPSRRLYSCATEHWRREKDSVISQCILLSKHCSSYDVLLDMSAGTNCQDGCFPMRQADNKYFRSNVLEEMLILQFDKVPNSEYWNFARDPFLVFCHKCTVITHALHYRAAGLSANKLKFVVGPITGLMMTLHEKIILSWGWKWMSEPNSKLLNG